MKIKNITNSIRQCYDRFGNIHLVKPGEILELDFIKFDKRSFKEITHDEEDESVEQVSPKVLRKKTKKLKGGKSKIENGIRYVE